MSTPTLLELCDKATPGPYFVVKAGTPEMFHHIHGVACIGDHFIETDHPQGDEKSDAQLIARMSPEVCRRVYEALKSARKAFFDYEMLVDGEAPPHHRKMMDEFNSLLAALDGKDTPQDGK